MLVFGVQSVILRAQKVSKMFGLNRKKERSIPPNQVTCSLLAKMCAHTWPTRGSSSCKSSPNAWGCLTRLSIKTHHPENQSQTPGQYRHTVGKTEKKVYITMQGKCYHMDPECPVYPEQTHREKHVVVLVCEHPGTISPQLIGLKK